MARMFGFIGNRADLGALVLASSAEVLRVRRAPDQPLGWGIGFYQAGEVLLRRRPLDDREEIDLAEAASDVRADVLLGHVRLASVGALRTENTHPFRYRSWLWAQTGTILGFERLRERLIQAQPEFLRRNVRGETDSELFFYLFLSFLHAAGHRDDAHASFEAIYPARRRSASRSPPRRSAPRSRSSIGCRRKKASKRPAGTFWLRTASAWSPCTGTAR